MSMDTLLEEGWIACPECGTQIDDWDESAPEWTWRLACPNCDAKIAGRIS